MDIVDVVLAKALSPKNQSDNAVKQAQTAAQEAKQAAVAATNAVANVAEVDITETNDAAAVTTEVSVKKNGKTKKATMKKYKSAGTNEDGTMTQKAIKEYVDSKATSGDGSSANFGSDNAGTVVVVGEDGGLTPGTLTETSIIRTQIVSGTYQATEALGLEIDYENKTFTRVQESVNYNAGEDFDKYSIYGGINRCLVDDDGAIIAFYGEDVYIDNFSTGYQTMVYVPKFYYMRVPTKINGDVIKKEVIMVSGVKQPGFKVHPAFINEAGEEVDYFLYPAYEGSTFDVSANAYNRNDGDIDFAADKLASITNAKPISGLNNELTIENAEKLANNRGEGWHITSIKAESAIQMLAIIEFGTLNAQQALEAGISSIENSLVANCASYTGSTAALGNKTGHAEATVNEREGIETTYNSEGRRAISYRGIEDFWGNIWRFVGGLKIKGNGVQKGGVPFVCDNLDYANANYTSVGFSLPNTSNWISNFGYANEDYDWIFMPVAADDANSLVPVGDYVWVEANLDGENLAVIGGNWSFKENDGLFYYGFDKATTFCGRTFGARIMFVPKKNSIYEENIAAWKTSIGG